MLQIIAFNWPWYIAALLGISAVVWISLGSDAALWFKAAASLGAACALWWSLASLLVSHWVYDLSSLRNWKWIQTLQIQERGQLATIHSGFQESTGQLRRFFPNSRLLEWDIYSPRVMTERSIRRARKLSPALAAIPAAIRSLPGNSCSLDAVFLIFAAHELRQPAAREHFFCEIRRILKPDGMVVLVEHLRDWNNFLAYGPGALHFLPRKEWIRLAAMSGLGMAREVSITPFVRVFCLGKLGTI